jgi:myo-inositol 2-dehydrogenase/D-chiro-inositol 1-dehydrogenase
MRFVLIGRDPLADAFVEAGLERGYSILGYLPVAGDGDRPSWLTCVPIFGQLEDVAGAQVDFLVLSGEISGRADRLRKVLRQDPTDLVIATPASHEPDVYYEAALVQSETRIRLLPLLAETGSAVLETLVSRVSSNAGITINWIELTLPLTAGLTGALRFSEGWTCLRRLAGEVTSVSATGVGAETGHYEPVVAAIEFRRGHLGTIRWAASCTMPSLQMETGAGPIIVEFADWSSDASLRWCVDNVWQSETVPGRPAGPRWLARFEAGRGQTASDDWLEATRAVELAAATQRSLARRRAISLDFEQVSEQAAFKSVMTSVGCGLLVGATLFAILLVPLQAWLPFHHVLAWFVLPVVVLFLALQLFGLAARRANPSASTDVGPRSSGKPEG